MSRREKRRQFSGWLAELFFIPRESVSKKRPILVEPLEHRQLMAADGFMALLGSSYSEGTSSIPVIPPAQSLVGEGELDGEGENAPDLVAFAKALTDSGTRFFGAAWCPFCTQQKQLFQDGSPFLPFIEVTNPDRTPNQIAIDEGVTEYPTWEFPDGSRLTGVQTLETLAQRANLTIPQSSTPSIAALPNVSVGIGSPLHIPIDAYDPNGNPLTITVTSSNPNLLSAQVLSGNRSLRLSTQGFGDMVFELFEDKAPVPAGRVIAMAQSGFYDSSVFHRVINNFVIQGGDAENGNGTGGSTLGDFDDQFHLDLQHNRTGMLSYAKSSDDTNDSQFFITEGPQRFLDFNHSVFGQLVEGEAIREAISNTATNSSDRPLTDVVINTATIFTDNENGVILLKASGTGTGTATITVTVSDTEGNSTSQAFQATVIQDTANGAPFLNPIPDVVTTADNPVTVNLTAQDAENDTLIYSVQKLGTENFTVTVDSATGVATVIPPVGFTGELQFRATVRQSTTPTTSSPDDNQVVRVIVSQSVPTGIDLVQESDSGSSVTDNVTNAQSLTFAVSGTTPGAIVEILSGGNVVGTATATSSQTNVLVNNVSSLGQGSVLFTSRQRVGGTNSAQSQGLSVRLDNQAPVAINDGLIPASAVVGSALSVDVNHPEEGTELTYALTGAPAGMTINSATGLLSWTPTAGQLGTQALTLRLTDVAGNVRDQAISINVIEQPQVRISLNAVDLSGLPITTIATGQQFKVQVVLTDLRTGATIPNSPTGVFAAYVDLLFDANVIEPIATDPINYPSPYRNDISGTTTTPGLIDELGAFSELSSRLGSDPRTLTEITFLAKAAGNPNLRTESADEAGNDILLYDVVAAIPSSKVDYGNSAFVVGANFQVANDVFNFNEDAGVQSLNVLSNDQVSGGAVLTISAVSSANGGGTVTIAQDGKSINYTSAANFNGAETFTYTAQNQQGVPLTATVTIQVTDINDPPVALNDTFTVFRNSTQNVLEVLNNDSSGVDNANSESLSVTAVSAGSAGGTIELGPSGLTVRYSPATGFQGTETFSYTLRDSRGGTATGTVSVAVNLENPPPTPQNDSFTVQEDAAQASFDVLANDTTDNPSETLSISAVGASQVGSAVTVSTDGQRILYRPGTNFSGNEVLTYTLRDSGGATAIGQMTFTVSAVNDPPDAVNDTLTALSSQTTTSLNVLANDINVDTGETLRVTTVSQPPSGSGTLSISTDGRTLNYTAPNTSFEGQFSFTYTIDDGTGLTDTATVTLNVSSFTLRDISGTVAYGDRVNDVFFSGLSLSLTGTDLTGAAVSKQTQVAADGSYSFDALSPGDYRLIREPLAFLNDSGASIEINSAATDGDLVSNLFVTGALRVGFFDIRDFLGSTTKNSLTVAVQSNGVAEWIAPHGDWAQLNTLQANLDVASNSLRISASNGAQTNLQATIPLSGSTFASIAGQESSMQLLRVRGNTTRAGLAASSSSSSTSSVSNNSTLSGEGEAASGTSVVSGEAVPAIQRTVDLTQSSAPQLTEQQSQVPLTPSQAIRQLLGSNSQPTTGSDAPMSAAAIDEAMESVLPSLQLKLSGELQDTLANGGDASVAATNGT